MYRGQLLLLGEHLKHERCGGQRESEAHEQRNVLTQPHEYSATGQYGSGDQNLRQTQTENLFAQHPESARLKLQADNEKEKDNTQLGEVQDIFPVGDEPEAPRSDHHTSREIAQYRAESEPAEQRHGDDRGPKKNRGFFEKFHLAGP